MGKTGNDDQVVGLGGFCSTRINIKTARCPGPPVGKTGGKGPACEDPPDFQRPVYPC